MVTTKRIQPAAATADYEAVQSGVARYDATARGRLRFTQRDRADLIHRLSTNDVRKLTPGDGTRTVLTNHNARIIDLLTVYALPEHLLVTTSPDQRGTVLNLFRKNIFFNDRVGLEDITDETVEYQLYGPQAAAFVGKISGLDVGDWPLHHIQAASLGGSQGWIARIPPLGGDGFAIFGRAEDRAAIEALLEPVTPLQPATYDTLRVEQGYPAPGRELSLEYIPLETRLTDAVSFTKGCYVGQEIIARMESRNRLAKQLMGLRLARMVEAGGKLQRDGKETGDLTSVVESPRFGPIGLAYVRTAAAEPGTVVQVADGVDAEVVELPFVLRDA
jgi:aminomethyltransferase